MDTLPVPGNAPEPVVAGRAVVQGRTTPTDEAGEHASHWQAQTESHRSPPPGLLASVFFVLFAASIVMHFVLTHGAPYPTPFRSLEALQTPGGGDDAVGEHVLGR